MSTVLEDPAHLVTPPSPRKVPSVVSQYPLTAVYVATAAVMVFGTRFILL